MTDGKRDTVVWHLRALNTMRRFFKKPERRYLTDRQWKDYMRSITPQEVSVAKSVAVQDEPRQPLNGKQGKLALELLRHADELLTAPLPSLSACEHWRESYKRFIKLSHEHRATPT